MSMQRECLIYKANNNKWYIALGNREHSDLNDSTTYGPFNDKKAAYEELQHHSNPGSYSTNDTSLPHPPVECQPPTRRRW